MSIMSARPNVKLSAEPGKTREVRLTSCARVSTSLKPSSRTSSMAGAPVMSST